MTKTRNNNDDQQATTQRDWHDLKPGDQVFFATGWYEVFDAYASGMDRATVKLIVNGRIETYQVRTTGGKATCRI